MKKKPPLGPSAPSVARRTLFPLRIEYGAPVADDLVADGAALPSLPRGLAR